jgi:ubiquinone/menaquinone biosynthesis C-methylase UbiE
MGPQEHKSWNEEMARRYDPESFITRSGFPIRAIEAMRLAATIRALGCRPGDAVLDLGCGPGNLLGKLIGARIVGVDLSESLLSQARRRAAQQAHVELLCADAQDLPLAPSSFDRLVCSELLEHVLDPSAVIAEIHRVCRPGARVVFTVPNERLINLTKRLVLALGLGKLVAGGYAMSKDMLNAWHLRQVGRRWLVEACRGRFRTLACWGVPSRFIPYHHVLALEAEK